MRSHNGSPSARAANGSVTSTIRVVELLEVVKKNYPNCCRIAFATIMESQKRKLQEHCTPSKTPVVKSKRAKEYREKYVANCHEPA